MKVALQVATHAQRASRLHAPHFTGCHPIAQEAMVERLQFICREERVDCPPAVLKELMVRSEGHAAC